MQLDPVVAFFVTTVIGIIGGLIFLRLKIPAGAMIGAMIGVMVFNILSESAFYPDALRKYVQIFSGILIGTRIQRKDISELKKVIVPSILLIISLFVLNLVFAALFTQFGGLDINTSLFAATPGGMSDMALIAEDLGANTAQVAMLQLTRILFIISIFPSLFKWLSTRGWRLFPMRRKPPANNGNPTDRPSMAVLDDEAAAVACLIAADACPLPEARTAISLRSWFRTMSGSISLDPTRVWRFLLTVAVAIVGGLIFFSLEIPAGAMIGSMLFVAVFGVLSGKALFPTGFRPVIQITVGCFLGSRMTYDSLLSLKELFIPTMIMLVGVILASLVFGYAIHKITGLAVSTCLLACTPGGLGEMSLIAEELGCDAPKVAVMQTFRLMIVIMLFPTLLRILSGILT